jgi:hypothetical protein
MPTSPPGNNVVVTVGGGATLIDKAWVADADLLSVAFTVKFAVPIAEGVPLIKPAGLIDKPVGNAPAEIDQVNGGVPPLAAKLCE